MTLAHPGNRLVLRQGNYIQVLSNPPAAYDLASDPHQMFPLGSAMNAPEHDNLARWSKKAIEFLGLVRHDLLSSWSMGKRCVDCALSDLIHLDTLENWNRKEERE